MPAKILVIEDEAELRSEMVDYLARRGHSVTGCGSIREAYDAFSDAGKRGRSPDVIVTDIRLPDGDGGAFYVANARRFPRARWVMMSGDHDLERLADQLHGLSDLPRCVVLDKPVPLRLLNRFISDVVAEALVAAHPAEMRAYA